MAQGFNQNGITNAQINNGTENHYAYDGAGRMTGDPFKGLTILYNHLDLPRSIDGPNGLIKITYDATGRKWLQQTEKKSRIYAGALEFVKTEETGNEYKMEAANTGDGRLILDEDANAGAGQIYPEYHHKDHLGNTRVAFTDRNENGRVELLGTDAEVTQQLDYYPFGLQHKGEGLFHESGTPTNRFQFNGIEHNEELGLDMAAFRSYDPAIGKWLQVDPLSELAPELTPYRMGFNNPISFTDPLGLFETRGEARRYKRANGLRGRTKRTSKDKDGNKTFAFTDRDSGNEHFYGSVSAGNFSESAAYPTTEMIVGSESVTVRIPKIRTLSEPHRNPAAKVRDLGFPFSLAYSYVDPAVVTVQSFNPFQTRSVYHMDGTLVSNSTEKNTGAWECCTVCNSILESKWSSENSIPSRNDNL